MKGTRNAVSIDGQRISFIEDGDGNDTRLFLHGWGGSAESFQSLWNELRAQGVEGKFIAIDFPGFGESDLPPSPWSVEDYALCVVKYLDAQGINSVHLISHSFGGRVSTKLSSMHHERVARITYIAAAGIPSTDSASRIAASLRGIARTVQRIPLLKTALSPLRKFIYKLIGSEYLEMSGVMRKTFSQVVDEDLTPYFSSITQPTTIVWGRNDSYVPVDVAERMSELIPQATLHIFEDGRHGIHHTHAKQISSIIASSL